MHLCIHSFHSFIHSFIHSIQLYEKLGKLEGGVYGELALKARQMLDSAKMPSFVSRLVALKEAVFAAGMLAVLRCILLNYNKTISPQ
jgi:hypothetical protein